MPDILVLGFHTAKIYDLAGHYNLNLELMRDRVVRSKSDNGINKNQSTEKYDHRPKNPNNRKPNNYQPNLQYIKEVNVIQWGLEFRTHWEFGWSIVVRF